MPDDLEARLARLEADWDARATSWLRRAASEHNWIDPDTAAKVVKPGDVDSPRDAARLIGEFTTEHPNFVKQETPVEAERRWGQELLDGLEAGGRR